jgi:hypothetical protein
MRNPGPAPVNANFDDETGVGVVAAEADLVIGSGVGEVTSLSTAGVCPPLGLWPPLAELGGFVVDVVVDVGVTPPQL